MSIDINELTIGQVKEIAGMVGRRRSETIPDGGDYGFFEIGKNYFIRTVTHHHIGKLIGFDRGGRELVLEKAVWVPDDGRFTQAMKKGDLKEVELFHPDKPVMINRETIIDTQEWQADIPESQK